MDEKTSDFVDSNVPKNEENEYFKRVYELFSPVRQRWTLVQEVLLWQKLQISIVCFNVINVLFWVFITPRLQIAVGLAILASLLWLISPFRVWVLSTITSKKLSARNEKGANKESEDVCELTTAEGESETSSTESKIVSYEDLCSGVAVVWKFVARGYLRLVKIKEENIYKFYGLLVLIIVVVAIIYQRFPVANIFYLTVMFLFLWPSIVFYGIKDKITRKLQQLFKPFLTQWQHSQTKRKRDIVLKDHREDSDLSDDDDNFSLNSSKETEAILSAALPVNRRHEASYLGQSDSMESSVISTEGLEFPSLRRESVESYNSDDFIEGLNFGSFSADAGSHHSSIDSLGGDTSERQDPENEHIQRTRIEENALPESVPLSDVEQEVRRRVREPSPVPPPRNKSLDDLQGFEIVESSEIENVTRSNDELKPTESSYIASGVGYVGKFLGYSS